MNNRIVFDEPADAYYRRALHVASNSGLTQLARCPAAYLFWVEHPEADEETAALAFGKAAHMAALEPDRFGDCYTVLPADAPRDLRYLRGAAKPSDATKAAIEWWDTWEATSAGRGVLTDADYRLAVAMGQSLRRLPMAFDGVRITGAELFDACQKEVTLYWIDEETGVECKARADLYAPDLGFAGDLKFCRDASRAGFFRAVNSHRYHVQDAHYVDGFRACGAPLRSFGFFPAEKAAPYLAASYHLGPASQTRGYELRQAGLRRLKACLESGEFPGYTTTMTVGEIPAYGMYDADEEIAP